MSTTSAPEFSNLPTDAIGKIIEKCDLKEQLTLRKVSKDLRSLVDEQKNAYKSIEIYPTDSYSPRLSTSSHALSNQIPTTSLASSNRSVKQVDTEDRSVFHHKIPDDSNKMLEFELDYDQYQIVIEKKNS
ncbi:hypothetical protein GCK72_021029 [Caenorhabditis remanei]|uniref:F-box domain-containing protein n=1 Tax=Caenorhabditis remanei TaxID=31234 RepID=A0A6A5GIF2_CAERE|nr:hypothetical protein GCK72_021029 [Caenorhabditis remanei]KAF1754466.1 hypothetical protein GCK72_021029 [Caenorhabditis remanei]